MKNFRKIKNREELEGLINRVLFKTFFHNPEWQDFLEKEFKWLKFEHYLYKDEALLSFGKFKVFGREKLVSLPFCEYGGPLPLRENIDFKEFEKDVVAEFSKDVKIKFHPKIKMGNKDSDVSTYWIENLKDTSEQELFKSFRKTLRHEIKDVKERGLEIKKCSNLKDLKKFYNLYVSNLKRKKTIPYQFSVIEFLYHSPGMEVLLAYYRNKIIAGSLFLHYSLPYFGRAGNFVHYFFSASDYKYKDFGATCLILWKKIRDLIGQDVIFDFGATAKGSQLDIFKRGWRGKEYPILQLGIKRSEENLRSSKLIRSIWGLLPNFVIRRLSSYLIKYRI